MQSLNSNHFFIFDIWLLMVLNFRYKWIRSLSGLSMYFYLAHTYRFTSTPFLKVTSTNSLLVTRRSLSMPVCLTWIQLFENLNIMMFYDLTSNVLFR